MPVLFNLDKIKFATDEPTYNKAIALYASGKVTQFKEGIGAYSALVLGTQPYHVSIEARRFGLGDCECYLGQNDTLCKHLVAVSIHAVLKGKALTEEQKIKISYPVSSGKLGVLSAEELRKTKKEITASVAYIKPYRGHSRTWFSYQNSLDEGCSRLAQLVSNLPVSQQTAELLVDLLLRLDKKLSTGGVDDSNGTVGSFIEQAVFTLQEYSKINKECVGAFKKLCIQKSCFGWEETLVNLYTQTGDL